MSNAKEIAKSGNIEALNKLTPLGNIFVPRQKQLGS